MPERTRQPESEAGEASGDEVNRTCPLGHAQQRGGGAGSMSTSVFTVRLRGGIQKTPEFEKKGLAQFAVNVGTKCGHGCTYCSSSTLLRHHQSFKAVRKSSYEQGFAVVDPTTPERVAADAKRMKKRGMVQLCTTVDGWAPEATAHGLGRRCLEAILTEPGWSVRVLTKNAAVEQDFDLIEKHRAHVLVGLSITGTATKERQLAVIEPNAAPVSARIATMREASRRGFRVYGMLCPLMPGIADSHEEIDELVRFLVELGAEEIFAEPVNARGNGLRLTQAALEAAGFAAEAAAVQRVRNQAAWSKYAADLLATVQDAVRRHSDISKLRYLLYGAALQSKEVARIREDDAGVVWLGKQAEQGTGPA